MSSSAVTLAWFAWIVTALMLLSLHGDAIGLGSVGAAGGAPARGRTLFASLPCASCHDISRPSPGGDICPNLGSIAADAARTIRLPAYRGKAKDAAGYIRESIVDPNAYLVPGEHYRAAGGQSVMPSTFGAMLSESDLDDLVAFLLAHR